MPRVKLEVRSMLHWSSFGEATPDGKRGLNFKVRFPAGDRLILTDDLTSDDVEVSLSVSERTSTLVEWATGLVKQNLADEHLYGLLHFYGASSTLSGDESSPASLMFELWPPPEVLATLLAFAQQGRHPESFTLAVNGLDYVHQRPGEVQVGWANTKQRDILPIIGAEYSLPVLSDPEEAPGEAGTSTAMAADLVPQLRQMVKYQQWTFGLGIGIAIGLALKGCS